MGVLVSVSTLHQVSTVILSLWIQQMHQTSHEVLLMILVSLLAITSPAGSQRPLKCVSKKHNKNCLYNIFYKKSYQILTTIMSLQRGFSYSFLCQFTMMVGRTRCYLWLTTGPEQPTVGQCEVFLLIFQKRRE